MNLDFIREKICIHTHCSQKRKPFGYFNAKKVAYMQRMNERSDLPTAYRVPSMLHVLCCNMKTINTLPVFFLPLFTVLQCAVLHCFVVFNCKCARQCNDHVNLH